MPVVVEEILQEDDADVHCGDHVNDQEGPFDRQKDGILIRHDDACCLLFVRVKADCW